MKLHHSCFIINRVVADTTSEEGRQRGPWEGFLVLVDLRMTGKRKNRYVKAIVKVDQKFLCFCYYEPKIWAISRKLKELRGDIWYGKSPAKQRATQLCITPNVSNQTISSNSVVRLKIDVFSRN